MFLEKKWNETKQPQLINELFFIIKNMMKKGLNCMILCYQLQIVSNDY